MRFTSAVHAAIALARKVRGKLKGWDEDDDATIFHYFVAT